MMNPKIWEKSYGYWVRKRVAAPPITEKRYPLMDASKYSEQLAAAYSDAGYTIHDGNNPRMPYAKKWKNHIVVCIRRTNSKTHGHCINTTFATKKP